MSARALGPVRALLAALAAGGLVYAASQSTAGIDLSRGATTAPEAGSSSSALTSSSLTCVGPELLGIRDVPDQAQDLRVVAASAPAQAGGGNAAGSIRLQSGPAGANGADRRGELTVTTPAPVTVTGKDGGGLGLLASQEFDAATPTLNGYSTGGCGRAVAEAWLLAGAGEPGRQERLLLANPGANEVSVDVAVLGAKGPVASDGGRGIVVPGRGRTSVLLDALAPGEPMPAVHVTVRGGAVVPALSDTWLDGSVAAGLETTTAGAAPATRQVVPIVDLAQAGVLRVAVPGDSQAVVSARLLSATGAAPLPGGGVQRIPAGTTLDTPLSDIPAGTYAVEVSSDVPVVAAGYSQARAGAAVGDFAWAPATPALPTLSGMAFSEVRSPSRSLALVSMGSAATASVVLVTDAGVVTKQVAMAADTLTLVDLGTTARSVWVTLPESATSVHAAVLSTIGSGPTRQVAVSALLDAPTKATATRATPLP